MNNANEMIFPGNLKVFAQTVEQEVYGQLYRLLSLDAFRDAKIRIMPDTHAGMGCVIGFTAALGDKVVPNLVGVDIGCGMFVQNLGQIDIDLPALDKFIREHIPSGSGVNEIQGTRVEFPELKDMRMYKNLRNIDHLQSSIGSLGGGNHFIELDRDSNGNVYLVIHTGSRNLGQQVCKHYQKLAVDQCNKHSADIKREINSAIEQLKAEGRQKESSRVISEIKAKYGRIDKVPADLCYLTGELRDDYLHDMKICQEFARRNREEIARRIFRHIKWSGKWGFHTIHNYIDFTDKIIRKGAIRCNQGEMVIIPLNMRDGSILAIGKGNEDWNFSGPHGAGRLMSRSAAKESISMKDFRASMEGIYTTSVNKNTLDESPMAYKNANEIVEAIRDTVDVIEVIKPIYNFKASETDEDYNRQK
jgi:RNA-splicing ligase RtcB